MKSSSPSSNFLYLVLIIVTISFLNTHSTVIGKRNKAGGHHFEVLNSAEPLEPAQPGVLPAQPGVLPPQPIVEPAQPGVLPAQPGVEPAQPGVLPPQPIVEPAQPGVLPAQPPSETTFEMIIINHASEGMDTVNVSCTPGAPPPGPPGAPPNPPSGPPVEPHLLNTGERFSWTFEYPDATADISYLCRIDWIGHNQGLVSLFDRDSYTDADCKGPNGNHCFWTIAPDGFYHSREDAPFPGPQWTYRWPWGL